MFYNIKILKIHSGLKLINASEFYHKIHLPKLKELQICNTSELLYFIGLESIEKLTISQKDDVDI